MTDWNFTAPPLDRKILIALDDPQQFVGQSQWLKPGKERLKGRWENIGAGQTPMAWMDWPKHPKAKD